MRPTQPLRDRTRSASPPPSAPHPRRRRERPIGDAATPEASRVEPRVAPRREEHSPPAIGTPSPRRAGDRACRRRRARDLSSRGDECMRRRRAGPYQLRSTVRARTARRGHDATFVRRRGIAKRRTEIGGCSAAFGRRAPPPAAPSRRRSPARRRRRGAAAVPSDAPSAFLAVGACQVTTWFRSTRSSRGWAEPLLCSDCDPLRAAARCDPAHACRLVS